ncbi:MAG TPA: hypothetical protein DCZ94_14725 [Lentisphaeria bacterium]|nr:MAG: hypothetical protein A2X48_02880 [Lentisphaerae bacterium GWF2_49_21]HBC88202.1 hypothetical protein [Lentisphaeria bacterium]
MRNIANTNTFMFLFIWVLLVIFLVKYPGFECRAFFFGLIPGYWPFAIYGEFHGDNYGIYLMILSMVILCILEIVICTLLMDIANVTKNLWYSLFFLILLGMTTGIFIDYNFRETWMNASIWIDRPTNSYFYRYILIPDTIVCGIYGLYLSIVIGVIYSLFILIKRKLLSINSSSGKPAMPDY